MCFGAKTYISQMGWLGLVGGSINCLGEVWETGKGDGDGLEGGNMVAGNLGKWRLMVVLTGI